MSHDKKKELGLLHGMYGSMEVDFEVQRTIKRAELTAFTCMLKKVIGPIKVHVDNKGIIDGRWRGETKCVDPKASDADLWIKIWEEQRNLGGPIKVSNFEKFVTEGNEKAGELANVGAMLDQGFMAEMRAKTVQQVREEVCARSKLPLFGGRMEGLRRAQAETKRTMDFRG